MTTAPRFESLLTDICASEGSYSINASCGGGGHATCIIGSGSAEKAAHEFVKAKLQQNILTTLTTTSGGCPPTTRAEMDAFLTSQRTFLSGLKLDYAELFVNIPDPNKWLGSLQPPYLMAFTCARQAFTNILLRHQILNSIQ
eukprot:PhF_6_TR39821/c0_g1_i1/m.59213